MALLHLTLVDALRLENGYLQKDGVTFRHYHFRLHFGACHNLNWSQLT